MIFDEYRKKWLVLTPEEWVRQHFAKYLEQLGYPAGLFALETQLVLNGMSRRADIVVYNQQRNPVVLAECKAPNITITQKTFEQAAAYNAVLKVPFLLLTNGMAHYCIKTDEQGHSSFVEKIPDFTLLNEL